MSDQAAERARMVEAQLARRGIRDRRVLEAMREVPREAFVRAGPKRFAYDDRPLPIGCGQTISQPYIVALMIEAGELEPDDTVLEIGAGSGYAAAVMARIVGHVHAVERHAPLGEAARKRLIAAGIGNVDLHIGDGTLGWPDAAPFDAIIVAAGAPSVPDALKEQLRDGGRLVIPVGGDRAVQELHRITRTGKESWTEETVGAVRFVPLIGAHGWTEDAPG